MFTLKALFNILTNIGVDTTGENAQSITATNMAVLITWVISLPYVFVFYALDLHYLFIINFSMEVLYPTVLLLNRFHYHFTAKNWRRTLFLSITHYKCLCLFEKREKLYV